MNKSMFLKSDLERASREADCYIYCQSQAMEHSMNGNFEKAAIYHENVIRSLRELQKMKDNKEHMDKLAKILEGITPELILRRMLS
ncbi:hypothetical protein [Oceanobacillus sp. Castelsardo]|uniref:hypothetical protein n=1 Tax=Oceanobacillus sp. Castelsardo TaxID=1851204 RepID=UPI00083856C9|nr:hypothetical protein [Oceanobacillus sp. Castelsardo]